MNNPVNITVKLFVAALPFFIVSCLWQGRGNAATESAGAENTVVEAVIAAEDEPHDGLAAAGTEDPAGIGESADLPEDSPAEEVASIAAIMADFPELGDYEPYVPQYGDMVLPVTGNFFGDRDDDLALLVRDTDSGSVGLFIVNKGDGLFAFMEEENPGGNDYYWVGEMRTVPAGEPLWSNYDDDFRAFEDVPEDEIVYLPYDAIFVHAAESCGGGFIFWKDGRWNWLQQE